MIVCTSASLTTRQYSERKEEISTGGQAPIVVFLPLDCVGNIVFCMACCILQIGAVGARVNDDNMAYNSCVRGGCRRVPPFPLSCSFVKCLISCFVREFSLSERPCVINDRLDFARARVYLLNCV